MENYFSEVMSKYSDKELQEIIANRQSYVDEAYVAAIDELQKRNLATNEVLRIREEIIKKQIENERHAQIEKNERKVERKKALKEALELLKPSKEYFYTPFLIYLNILVYIIMVLNGVHPLEPSVESLLQWGGNLRVITLNGQAWRLLTNVFLHGGLFHLLFNIYALLYVGGLLEKKFGKQRFILVYIITGVLASIASISWNENIVSIGASGAIFGIYGLFLSLLISKNYKIPEESRQNLISSILIFIAYNLYYGITEEGIDNAAHIGGLVSGFIIGYTYYPSFSEPKYSKLISFGLVAISLVLISLMPKFIDNPQGELQSIITKFTDNENKALWMYREEISDSPEKSSYYLDRLQSEGIDLWNNNLQLLNSLSNLPPYIKERVDIMTEYCNLRIESCMTMQSLIKDNNTSDRERLEKINIEIQSKINKLKELNK